MFKKISEWWDKQSRKFKLSIFGLRLRGKTFSVFVREVNKSKTDLELFVERTLIKSGAKVHPSNQKSCLDFMTYSANSIVSAANYQILGTLKIEDMSLDQGDIYYYTFSYRVISVSDNTIIDAGCYKFSGWECEFKESDVFKKFAEHSCINIAQYI